MRPPFQKKPHVGFALQRVLRTFFDGSAQMVVAALLDPRAFHLSDKELDDIEALIDKARNRRPGGKP
jgi:predicted transcriptional regulator